MCVKSSRVEKLEIPCAKMFRSVQERIIDRNVEGDREGDRFIQKMIKFKYNNKSSSDDRMRDHFR